LESVDQGINPLDEAFKEDDIAYSQNKALIERHRADSILIGRVSRHQIAVLVKEQQHTLLQM